MTHPWWRDAVCYQLYIRSFADSDGDGKGDVRGITDRLDHLVDLGVDFVELLPVNGFDGTHNWGYDGVLWYTVQESYGGPAAYQRFVDACHQRGLGVIQDVVYNHLGPSGNYLPLFMPIFSEGGANTWGSSVNLSGPDSDEVRRYILDNALMWLRDMHVDGLRLDAVHALVDERATHVLEEMAQEVDRLSVALGRPLTLIAESDLNDPRMVTPRVANGTGIHAQWSDDFHHALHSVLTGEGQGYYGDFAAAGLSGLAKTLTGAFFHDGAYSSFRRRHHGRPVDTALLPGWKFLGYLQDHDQIGNRAVGDRISASLSPGLLAVGATLVLTSPFTPMLFMGEEWGASTPWQFFTSHPEPELATAVRTGRRKEFATHGWAETDVPDPQDPATFERSKLDWSELSKPGHAEILDLYKKLIALRRDQPDLTDPRLDQIEVMHGDRYVVMRRGRCAVAVNLAPAEQTVHLPRVPSKVLLATEPGVVLHRDRVSLPPESAVVVMVSSHA